MSTTWLRHAHFPIVPTATVLVLVATGLLPRLPQHAVAVALLVSVLMGLVTPAWRATTSGAASVQRRLSQSRGRPTIELLLHLSPVVLLTVVFPIASHRIAQAQVNGVGLTSLLLASSLTVPWLSQAVCLPLYRAIGPLILGGDMEKIRHRFCEVWPSTFAQSVPAIAVFAVPVEIAMRWSVPVLGTYLALCVLHLAFAQSLVLANVGRNRVHWAVAWAGYATALLLLPTVWYLPPLVGLITQLVPLRHHLSVMRQPVMLDTRDVTVDLVRGVLLGAVLWSDKLFFFLRAGSHFAVTTVFLALLPAVLAYNYYFVRLAPNFDRSVLELRTAMEHEPYSRLTDRSRALAATVKTSISRTAFIGACLGFLVTYVVTEHAPSAVALVASVAVASWLFMMTTVLCYKLDYIGQTGPAQAFSAVHLVLCAAAFLIFSPGASLYATLVGFEVLLFGVALRSCLTHWRTSEYTLFWRHATAW